MQVWAAFVWIKPYPVFPALLLLDLFPFILSCSGIIDAVQYLGSLNIYDFYFFVKLIRISSNTNLSILTDDPCAERLS